MRIRIAELDPAGFRREARAALDVYVAAMGYSPRVTWQRSPIWHEHSTWNGFTAVAAFAPADVANAEIGPPGSPRPDPSPRRARRWPLPRRAPRAGHQAESRTTSASDTAGTAVTAGITTATADSPTENTAENTATQPERLVGICYGYRAVPGQWWFDRVAAGAARAHVPLPELAAELTELHVHPRLHGHGIGTGLLSAFLETRAEPSVLLSTPETDNEANNAWRLYRRMGFRDVLRDFLFEGDPRSFGILRLDLDRGAGPTNREPRPAGRQR